MAQLRGFQLKIQLGVAPVQTASLFAKVISELKYIILVTGEIDKLQLQNLKSAISKETLIYTKEDVEKIVQLSS
jgi:hypothetical protein